MDFQKVADSIAAMACIVSVEEKPDGSCGDVRIVTGNKAYLDTIEHPMQDLEMLTRKFVPNSLYTEYLTRDLNFEDFCFRAAVNKKCLHSYAHPDRYDIWFNMTFMPLGPDDGNIHYCAYIMEINYEANSERISNISGDIAAAVLETAIRLREAKDFRSALKDTVGDIRRLCEVEYCGMLLVDKENESCELLGEDYAEDSNLKPDINYLDEDFYPIARTWKDTIAGSNCLIAKNDADMEVVKERNPLWYGSLKEAGVKTIALFPLRGTDEEIGYMWAANFDEGRSAQIKEILELTTFVLGSETSNYMMVKKLRLLSSRDMLTGIMNRNEMNNYVDALSRLPEKSVKSAGVIFADLNGLKRTNDSKGHETGDVLLQDAASALRELFDAEQIFRAGGDEFVVILTGISGEELEKKVSDLRIAQTHYPDLSFAIGWDYTSDCREVRRALANADERMYEDKRRYYSHQGQA